MDVAEGTGAPASWGSVAAMQVIAVDALRPDPAAIVRIVDVLRAGGVVAYPTDTLYGLAVDPRSDDAVRRVFSIKGRDANNAIPLIAGSLEQASDVCELGALHLRLAHAFWPGPLALVGEADRALSRLLLAGGSTVVVRVPAHAVARAIARGLAYCITATSANVSGAPPAASAAEAAAALGDRVDAIVDAGPAPGGPPSTIVGVRDRTPVLVRAGAIAWDRVLKSLQ
jgi:L-threonylcarbamoyladenylate synthase